MTRTVSYEIYTQRSEGWFIDSVHDDKNHALFEARKLLESPRQTAIKVVEEKYDDETDKTISTTIFNEERGVVRDRPKNYRPEQKPDLFPRDAVERTKKDDTDFVGYLVKMVLVIGGICLALIGAGMLYMNFVGG